MVSNRKVFVLCLLQYAFILCYHLIYSLLFKSIDQTSKVCVWSLCVFLIILFFSFVFKNNIRLVVYVTMATILITVTYVGFVLETLAFGILIFATAGLILSMMMREIYILIWFISTTIAVIVYAFVFPEIVLLMVPSTFIYYCYVCAYIIMGINLYILVKTCRISMEKLTSKSLSIEKETNSKNIFWANISNEIRTPMNVINGMSRLLRSENLNIRAKEYTDQIENASDMLLNIVSDTLELSQMEAGTYEKFNADYNLYRLIHNTVMLASGKLKNDDINLGYSIQPNVPMFLRGDSNLLSKILLRLLFNSFVFTEKGDVKIEVSLDSRKFIDEKVHLVINISDNGKGIDEKELNDLFSGFDSINNLRTSEQESVGLSLKLCKTLIDIMEGEIKVESVIGKGTVFTLYITQDSGNEVTYEEYSESKSFSSIWRAPKARILVVDDTPTNLKLISGMIRLHGIEPDSASSGKECIEMMEKSKYDLVFLDYLMPELNGEDTLKIIKQKSNSYTFIDVPIIALTSKSLLRDRSKFLEMGFDEFISKPIDDKELENLMKRFLVNNEELTAQV